MFKQTITRLVAIITVLSLSVIPFLTRAQGADLKVTFPNGGESLEYQNVYPLQWAGSTGEVNLSLVNEDGVTPIATTMSRADGTGIYLWRVPQTISLGDDYRLLVVSGEASDVSDRPFNVINLVDTPRARLNQMANVFQILNDLISRWK